MEPLIRGKLKARLPAPAAVFSLTPSLMNIRYLRFFLGPLLFVAFAAPPSLAQVSLVADLAPGGSSSGVANLTVYDDALYFTAEADSDHRGLWRYDAQRDTTELIVSLSPDEVGPTRLLVLNGRLYFTVQELLDEGVFARIWSFDAETDTAEPISNLLWPFTQFFVYDGRLFFTSADSTGYALWAYDGATDSMAVAATDPLFATAADLTVYDNRLFFRAQPGSSYDDYELWSYDAATGEVAQAADINPSGSSYPSGLTVYGGWLFFAARDGGANEELWAFDAATGEATLAADITPPSNPNGSLPRDLTVYDGRLFFSTLGDNYDRELWIYDAATEQASFVADISPSGGELGGMTVFDGRLFFAGYLGSELWAYDAATDATSVLARDVRPGDLTVYGDRLFFSGFEPENGVELWVYNVPTTTNEESGGELSPTSLSPAFPNPTNGTATVTLTLGESQHVRLAVYDALGREVTVLHDGPLPASSRSFQLDGGSLPSGLYLVRATGNDFVATQRVMVLR